MRSDFNSWFFPHLYSWEVLDSLPQNRTVIYFPDNNQRSSINYMVEVFPEEGDTWVGNFAGSGLGLKSRVFTTPNANVISVDADGVIYFVNVNTPYQFDIVPVTPIVEIIPSTDYGILVLVGFTKLALYDKEGIRWISKISADGITVSEVANEKIKGLTWDPSRGKDVEFEIDIKSGSLKGGSAY